MLNCCLKLNLMGYLCPLSHFCYLCPPNNHATDEWENNFLGGKKLLCNQETKSHCWKNADQKCPDRARNVKNPDVVLCSYRQDKVTLFSYDLSISALSAGLQQQQQCSLGNDNSPAGQREAVRMCSPLPLCGKVLWPFWWNIFHILLQHLTTHPRGVMVKLVAAKTVHGQTGPILISDASTTE